MERNLFPNCVIDCTLNMYYLVPSGREFHSQVTMFITFFVQYVCAPCYVTFYRLELLCFVMHQILVRNWMIPFVRAVRQSTRFQYSSKTRTRSARELFRGEKWKLGGRKNWCNRTVSCHCIKGDVWECEGVPSSFLLMSLAGVGGGGVWNWEFVGGGEGSLGASKRKLTETLYVKGQSLSGPLRTLLRHSAVFGKIICTSIDDD